MENILPGLHYKVNLDREGSKPACIDVHKLAGLLPHGSGIDSDWNIIVRKNGDVTVLGSYHKLNQNGYYDGWVDFRFHVRRATRNHYVALRGPCAGQFQITKVKGQPYLDTFIGGGADHREYLYEMCDYALSQMGVKSIDSILVNSELYARTYKHL